MTFNPWLFSDLIKAPLENTEVVFKWLSDITVLAIGSEKLCWVFVSHPNQVCDIYMNGFHVINQVTHTVHYGIKSEERDVLVQDCGNPTEHWSYHSLALDHQYAFDSAKSNSRIG